MFNSGAPRRDVSHALKQRCFVPSHSTSTPPRRGLSEMSNSDINVSNGKTPGKRPSSQKHGAFTFLNADENALLESSNRIGRARPQQAMQYQSQSFLRAQPQPPAPFVDFPDMTGLQHWPAYDNSLLCGTNPQTLIDSQHTVFEIGDGGLSLTPQLPVQYHSNNPWTINGCASMYNCFPADLVTSNMQGRFMVAPAQLDLTQMAHGGRASGYSMPSNLDYSTSLPLDSFPRDVFGNWLSVNNTFIVTQPTLQQQQAPMETISPKALTLTGDTSASSPGSSDKRASTSPELFETEEHQYSNLTRSITQRRKLPDHPTAKLMVPSNLHVDRMATPEVSRQSNMRPGFVPIQPVSHERKRSVRIEARAIQERECSDLNKTPAPASRGWTQGVVSIATTPSGSPAPSSRRQKSKDEFLVKSKRAGMSYKEIRRLGNFTEAESTLRGRFRTLTKDKEDRVRRPLWTEDDNRLLVRAVRKLTTGDPCASRAKVPWKKVSEYISRHGGSYQFGNATCRKQWDELRGETAESDVDS